MMKTARNDSHHEGRTLMTGLLAAVSPLALAGLAVAGLAIGDTAAKEAQKIEETRDQSRIAVGSGERYLTEVERYTEGELSAEDLHQASLLGSRIVDHLNEGVEGLLDRDPERARVEIAKAATLIAVVRELLPLTTVTTVVTAADGKEVYRHVAKVQEDKIPLYRGMIAMEVVEPVIAAKEEVTELEGLRLADADIIHTSVLVDLSYMERKLNRAAALLETPDDARAEDALAQLVLAQTQGVQLIVNEEDNPLVTVQHALRLAERMVEEGKHKVARDNLRLAQIQLGTYRALVGTEAAQSVEELEKEIADLMPKTEEQGAAAAIRDFWERTVSLFSDEPGQARVVQEGSAGAAKGPMSGEVRPPAGEAPGTGAGGGQANK